MHLKWKLAALYAQRTLLEGSFFVTEGIPHMAPEGIQYYSQVCGKLQCLSYWKGTYLSGLVTKKVCFFPELTYPEVTELRKSDINTFLFTFSLEAWHRHLIRHSSRNLDSQPPVSQDRLAGRCVMQSWHAATLEPSAGYTQSNNYGMATLVF